MAWVVVQNAGTALFSLVTGPLADRRGNRLVLRWLLLAIAAMPIAAILFSYWGELGATLYPTVFFFVGVTPVGFKTLNNYALEISPAAEHPRYLSTLSLCIALPLLLSPALGLLVEAVSFEIVFFIISGAVFAGWVLTFRLEEPREQLARA
jgi:MFS family permease